MKFNPFRRLTVEEARAKLAEHASNAAQHHEIEALRLRYEIALLTVQADNNEALAVAYAAQAKGHSS